MRCEICDNNFKPNKEGSGGNNRLLCYTCLPEGFDRKERKKIRQALLSKRAREEKLAAGCSSCGYNKCGGALEWHHPQGDKLITPSNAIKQSWSKYKEETSKCILLCANCHREVHA